MPQVMKADMETYVTMLYGVGCEASFDVFQPMEFISAMKTSGMHVAYWNNTLELHCAGHYCVVASIGYSLCIDPEALDRAVATCNECPPDRPWKPYDLGKYPIDADAWEMFLNRILWKRAAEIQSWIFNSTRFEEFSNRSCVVFHETCARAEAEILACMEKQLKEWFPVDVCGIVTCYIWVIVDYFEERASRVLELLPPSSY